MQIYIIIPNKVQNLEFFPKKTDGESKILRKKLLFGYQTLYSILLKTKMLWWIKEKFTSLCFCIKKSCIFAISKQTEGSVVQFG